MIAEIREQGPRQLCYRYEGYFKDGLERIREA